MFEFVWSPQAEELLKQLNADRSLLQHAKAVQKALRFLRDPGPSYPSLNVHKWDDDPCPHGGELKEAYAENNTPAAWRIFFCLTPNKVRTLTIVAITRHDN